jgi:hypothetical protein
VRKHLSLLFVLVVGLASGLLAQDAAQDSSQPASVGGKWQMSWQGRGGAKQGTLQLEQDGSKLTGTFESDRGSLAVSGTVSGNNISFSTQSQEHHDFTMVYTGTVEGDKISGTFQPQGGQSGKGGGRHGGGQQNRSWTATRQAGNSNNPGTAGSDQSDDETQSGS